MKEKTKSILVIVGMILLFIIILLPPRFRIFVPRQEGVIGSEVDKGNMGESSEESLLCEHALSDKYMVSADILYENDVLKHYIISYNYIHLSDSVGDDSLIAKEELEKDREYVFFNSLKNISIKPESNSVITISLDEKLLKDNPDSLELKNYFQDVHSLREYLTSIGYSCKLNES